MRVILIWLNTSVFVCIYYIYIYYIIQYYSCPITHFFNYLGCDYNTLGMSYEANAVDAAGYANYHYNSATAASRKNARLPSQHDQTTELSDIADGRSDIHNNSRNDSDRRRNGSKGDEFSQRALLLQTESGPFEPEIPDTTQNFEPTSTFAMGSAFNVSPTNATRSKSKSKSNCNPFKKKSSTNVIYNRNNLYGTKNRKSSKQNAQVTLGSGGMTSTGLSFNKPYTSKKRPFCPSWQCLVLALVVGTTIVLCAGLVMYFFVWQSILGKFDLFFWKVFDCFWLCTRDLRMC